MKGPQKMKKSIFILLFLALVLALCACGTTVEEDVEKTEGYVSPTDIEAETLYSAEVPPRREDGVGVYYGIGAGLGRLTVSAEEADDVIVGVLSPAGLAFPELPEVPDFPVLVNPYPSGMGGPMYDVTPEMLAGMESELTRYLELLYGERDAEQYPFQYFETTYSYYNRLEDREYNYTYKSPCVERDGIRFFANPVSLGVNLENQVLDIAKLLPDGDLRQSPLLAAALDYLDIDDYLVEDTAKYQMDGMISEHRYCISEKAAESRQATLNREFRNIGITLTYEGNHLSVGFGEKDYPSVDAQLPSITLEQALDKVERFIPDLDRQAVKARVHYMAHIREEYLIPCWELYVPTENRAADGTPLYAVLWVPTVDTAALD